MPAAEVEPTEPAAKRPRNTEVTKRKIALLLAYNGAGDAGRNTLEPRTPPARGALRL